jgi:hypothetical protein
MADNQAMINLFHKCALGPVQSEVYDGNFRLTFAAPTTASHGEQEQKIQTTKPTTS